MHKLKFFLGILFLILVSCVSSDKQSKDTMSLFESDAVEDWRIAVERLKDDPNAAYVSKIFKLYMNRKYSPIREELNQLLTYYIDKLGYSSSEIIGKITSVDEFNSIVNISKNMGEESILNFATIVYTRDISDMKLLEEEALGKNLLSFEHLDMLYASTDIRIKLGVISSAGYMSGESVRNWLVEKLYSKDENIASGALLSLSKHGLLGYELIGDNLLYISPKLQLSAIDILIFNRVERAYPYFAELLIEPNPEIEDKILKAYAGFGKRGDIYIYDALRKANKGVLKKLLQLIKSRNSGDFLADIDFLLVNTELRYDIIELAFERQAWNFLLKQILNDNYGIADMVVSMAIEKKSAFLVYNSLAENFTINYFIKNIEYNMAIDYFSSQGFDEIFLIDYALLETIKSNLDYIKIVQSKNGEDEVVTKYFEIEQNINIGKTQEEMFFSGMEEWLRSGDKKSLNTSRKIKDSQSLEIQGSMTIKTEYLKSLSQDYRELLLGYEGSLKNISLAFRQISYRLKPYALNYLNLSGMQYLIK